MNIHQTAPAAERPRIVVATGPYCAVRNPGAIVIDVVQRQIYGLKLAIKLPPCARNMLIALLLNFGRHVYYEDIWEAIYGDREDGGPEQVANNVSRYINLVRNALRETNLRISVWPGTGLMISPAETARPQIPGYYHGGRRRKTA